MSLDISGSSEATPSISFQLVKELKDTLHTGQIVQGVVKEVVSPDKYILQINGVNTVGHAEIALEKGQTFFAGVREVQDKIILNLLDEEKQIAFLQSDLVRRIKIILSQMNITPDVLTIKSAVEFMKNNLPLDKEHFLDFLTTARSQGITENADIKTSVLLFKSGLPVSKNVIDWLRGFFKDLDIDDMLARSTSGGRESFDLSGIVQNTRNVLSGLSDILPEQGTGLDIEVLHKILNNLSIQGGGTAGDLEKEIAFLLKNSGLSLEHNLKDVFMRMTLTQDDFFSPLNKAVQFFNGLSTSSMTETGQPSLLNYAGLREALQSLQQASQELFPLLQDMSLKEMKDILQSLQYQDFAGRVKGATHQFFDRAFLFFRELQSAMDISGTSPDQLSPDIRQLMQELMKATQPFFTEQDRTFFRSFPGMDETDVFSEERLSETVKNFLASLEEKGAQAFKHDLKNILFQLIGKLEEFNKTLKQETLPSDPLSKGIFNASQFTKENLLHIIREQVSLKQSSQDVQDLQIVIPFMEGQNQRELSVFFRREPAEKKQKGTKDSHSAVLFLELSHIGPIRVDVKMAGKNLNCVFFRSCLKA